MRLPFFRAALVLFVLTCASVRASGFSVEGQVLGPDGKGLAGARVELRPVLRVYEQGVRDLEGKGEPEPAARTVTGTYGWYRLRCPGVGAWRVTVAAEGLVPRDSGPMVLAQETKLDILHMEAGADFTLRVVGENGRPLAGVRVASAVGVPDSNGWPQARRLGTTGADGTLRLRRAAKETLRLSLLAHGYPIRRAVSSDAGPVVLRLERGYRWILGVYDGGKAVPGTLIRDMESGLLMGRTGAAGWLIADAPNTGSWEAQVEVRDGRFQRWTITLGSAKEQAHTWKARCPLPPSAALVGRVVDQRTGRPVPGAVIWPAIDPAAFVTADISGSYRLPAWASPTGVWLRATAEGYFQEQAPVLPEGAEAVPPVLALTPSGFLTGTVVDEDGSPVAQAEVLVYFAGYDDEAARVRTGSDGSFRLTGLPIDWFDLEARRPGYLSFRIPGLELRPDSADLGALVLTRGRQLEGRVIGPLGEPVEGAEVWVVPDGIARARVWMAFDEAGPAAVTDQDGRFVLQGLNPRKVLGLDVCRPGYHTHWIYVERSEEGPVQVELARAARVSGRVIDPDGKPVAGASVDASLSGASRGHFTPPSSPCPHSGQFSSAETDAEGRFTLEPLDGGLFEIVAQAQGYLATAPQTVEVAAGWESAGLTLVLLRETREAVLPEAAPAPEKAPTDRTADEQVVDPDDERKIVLSGRILGIEPEDLPDVELEAYSTDRRIRNGFVDRDGIYRFLSMAPGTWEVIAIFEDRTASAKIVIAPGEEDPVLDVVIPQEP